MSVIFGVVRVGNFLFSDFFCSQTRCPLKVHRLPCRTGLLTSRWLQLKEGREPRSRKPFRIPEPYRKELRKTIDDLVKYKIIEPSVSPFVNPVFLVLNPLISDRSYADLRFVFDGCQINQVIGPDSHFIPRVEDLIDRVARLKYEAERASEANVIMSCLDQRTSF